MKISFKIKDMQDVNVPENYKRIRTGFDFIKKFKNQFPSLTFTKMFLLSWCNHENKNLLPNRQNFLGRAHKMSLTWFLLVSILKGRSEYDSSWSQ